MFIGFKGGKGGKVRIIWCIIMPPTKIIQGTREIHLSKAQRINTHNLDFHVAPNPKKIIQLDASGKQGRYVRIQLLDSDYLSLAEVQVMEGGKGAPI
jgi:hypothetical protein